MSPAIAVVGMACRYPDADSPAELWRNVLAQRRAFRLLPPERLAAADYLSDDPRAPDRTYTLQASILDGWEFDRARFRIAGSTFRSTDLAHWLALEVASDALADAGWPDGDGLARDRAGVVLGNTLTGEFSRSRFLRLRWPYVRRVLTAALAAGGRADQRLVEELEASFKAPFAPIDEDALAGALSNTIAGRICNAFDLGGGGYTVDAACAASLLAVTTACTALSAGDVDVALAGGVDLSLDPLELVGFAKAGALARSAMRVYDRRPEGFWPGEGCGFVVLERLEDALARGARVYAAIRGWGVSSDGAGGITRPEVEGQLRALRRAYERAGFGIAGVDVFEGHGTGTEVGDRAELQALTTARREDGARAPAPIGSIKANIGHTKAAAGIAGLIKATTSLHERVIPPTTGCEEPHELVDAPDAALRPARTPEPWPHGRRGRAAVSAFGFGGINTHAVLEGLAGGRRRLGRSQRVLARSVQDAELFLFAASDPRALSDRLEAVRAVAAQLSLSELSDLAAVLHAELPAGARGARAALVASTPAELSRGLEELAAHDGTPRVDPRAGIFLGFGEGAPRVGFLFPGQGSPVHLDGGALARRFGIRHRAGPAGRVPVDTAVAQPGIVASSLAGLALLRRLDVRGAVAVGHSLGELTAWHWAGALEAEELAELAAARGRAMAEAGEAGGAMATIAAGAGAVEELLVDGVVIAGYNAPGQTTVSGSAADVDAVLARARRAGMAAVRLPVSHAFHSPLVAAAADRLAGVPFPAKPPCRAVASTITGAMLEPGDDLRSLLLEQVTRPVRFVSALGHVLSRADALVEVGPGSVLQGLARQSTDLPVFALDAGGPSLRPPLSAAGGLFALGVPLRLDPLFAGRFTRPFDVSHGRSFLANPCEEAPRDDAAPPLAPAPPGEPAPPPGPVAPDGDVLAVVRSLVARRAELPEDDVLDGQRLLGDLHLTSIMVSELAVEAARRLGIAAPPATELANATVAELADALEAIRAGGRDGRPRTPDGIAAWCRPFASRLVERKRAPGAASASRWTILAPADHPLAGAIEAAFDDGGGEPAVLACLPPGLDEAHADLLLRAAAEVSERGARRCAFLQHGGGAAGFAKAMHLESDGVDTCVIDLPLVPGLLDEARREAESARGFREVAYDERGARRVPVLERIELAPGSLPLGTGDVLLVTGGGKGIGAECALGLADATGASVALIGRSRPHEDPELAENLRRFDDAGARYRYLAADVTDVDGVQSAVARVRAELGEVTAVLHAAGINVPRRLEDLDAEAVAATLAPKIAGLRNVLAALDPGRLRLLVTFGSIVGRIGLRGEAHYALANDRLAALVERLRAELPGCRCLNIEWSVWTGAGMGERLGTAAALAQEGIAPIPVEEGVGMLERLVAAQGLPASVVAAGRFGPPPTVELARPELPMRRFLERPLIHYPGIELVAEAEVSRGTDAYLDDHVLDGVPLLPAVLALEAMASAAQAVTEEATAPVLSEVRFERPITVPAGTARSIRIAALVLPGGAVDVAIRSEETGFAADHARGTCRFEPAAPGGPAVVLGGAPVALDPDELYGSLLFHGPRFRRLRGYRELRARFCVADVQAREEPWFGPFLPQALTLGDPGARDAVIHAVQACVPHLRLVPVGVERLIVHGPPKARETVRARERSRDGDTFVFDLVVGDAAGRVRERWEGLTLRSIGRMPTPASWPAALLAPYLERRLGELLGNADVSVALGNGGPGDRREASDEAMARALGHEVQIRRRPDGRPLVRWGRGVSAAHVDGHVLALAGRGPVACDAETATGRSEGLWSDLLGEDRLALARLLADRTDEDLDLAATRVWAAAECIKKAGLPITDALTLSTKAPGGWTLLRAGRSPVATFVARIDDLPHPVAIALLAPRGAR